MSTVDDQIASMLAAVGASDVLERRVASQREHARAVLQRQAERIARLERFFQSLQARGSAPGSAPAVDADVLQQLASHFHELATRQQASDEQHAQQAQLLADLAAKLASFTAAPVDPGSAVQPLLEQLAARLDEAEARRRADQEQLAAAIDELRGQAAQAQGAAAATSDSALSEMLACQQAADQQRAAQAAEQARLLAELTARIDALSDAAAGTGDPLQPVLAELAARVEQAEVQRRADQQQLAAALDELRSKVAEPGNVESASDEILSSLLVRQQDADEQRAAQAAEQAQVLAQLAARLETLSAAPPDASHEFQPVLADLAARFEAAETQRRSEQAQLAQALEQLRAEVAASQKDGGGDSDTLLSSLLERQQAAEEQHAALAAEHAQRLADVAARLETLSSAPATDDRTFQPTLDALAERLEQAETQRREDQQQLASALAELRTQVAQSFEQGRSTDQASDRLMADLLAWQQAGDQQRAEQAAEQAKFVAELSARLDALSITPNDNSSSLQPVLANLAARLEQAEAERRADQQQLATVLEQLRTQAAEQSEGKSSSSDKLLSDLMARQQASDEQRAAQVAEQAQQLASLAERLDALRAVPDTGSTLQPALSELAARLEKAEEQRRADQQQLAAAIEQLQLRNASHDSDHAKDTLLTELLEQQASTEKRLAEHAAQQAELLNALAARLETLSQTPVPAPAPALDAFMAQLTARLEESEQRRDKQIAQLAADVQQLSHAAPSGGEGSADGVLQLVQQLADEQKDSQQVQAEQQSRLLATVAELRSQVATLAQRLQDAPPAAGQGRGPAKQASHEAPAGMDWESAKKRLLAQLESESDESAQDGEEQYAEGAAALTLELTGQRLAQLVGDDNAQRDAEIEELKKQLQQFHQAAATASVIDKDELVQQERERLLKMQEEWQEKLRKAEIEISLERAKLARERTRLEEQLQTLQQDRAEVSPEDGKPNKNRWLARLGLLDENQ